jgi:hypothetical protein
MAVRRIFRVINRSAHEKDVAKVHIGTREISPEFNGPATVALGFGDDREFLCRTFSPVLNRHLFWRCIRHVPG